MPWASIPNALLSCPLDKKIVLLVQNSMLKYVHKLIVKVHGLHKRWFYRAEERIRLRPSSLSSHYPICTVLVGTGIRRKVFGRGGECAEAVCLSVLVLVFFGVTRRTRRREKGGTCSHVLRLFPPPTRGGTVSFVPSFEVGLR